MPRQTDFERRMAAVDELVQRLETAADPAARAVAQELVRTLMADSGTLKSFHDFVRPALTSLSACSRL